MSEGPGAALPLEDQYRIDEICDELDRRLGRGERPCVDDLVGSAPTHLRPHLRAELEKLEREYYPEMPGFEVERRLGKGGMGVVYLARDLALDRRVALKRMRAGELARPEERQRFRFEALATAKLDHPGIVPLHAVREADGQPFLVLEYLTGGSLEQHECAPREAARLVAEIARAVQHAHERGILHRDLKPANVLLDDRGRPRVTDFGLARRLEGGGGLTGEGAVVGTPEYMAPEQAAGQEATTAADVYALGAILYKLLTGRPPFRGATALDTLCLLQKEPVVPPRSLNRDVPADLEAVCLRCLEKQPADRYPSAAALADDLERFLNNEPVSAQPPGLGDWLVQALRARPQPSPHYAWAAPVWVAGLVFAQHASVFFLVQRGQPAWPLWAVMLGGWVGLVLLLWALLLRRFRHVPATERHSALVAVGNLLAQAVLFLAIAPWGSARDVLPLYPPLTVLSGLCFFVLGSTNWGRLLPLGLATMCLAPVMVAWPEAGPALFALAMPACLVWWGLAKWWAFVRPGKEEEGARASPSQATVPWGAAR